MTGTRWTIRNVDPAAIAKVQALQQHSGKRLGTLLSEAVDEWQPEPDDISAELANIESAFSRYRTAFERLVQELGVQTSGSIRN